MENDFPTRKRYRLPKFDYSTPGAYFITICTKDHRCIFSTIADGGFRRPPVVTLTNTGTVVENAILAIPLHYKDVSVDKYAIMPNHIHLLLRVASEATEKTPITRVVQHFKGIVTKAVGTPVWQDKFYDHVIRNQKDYDIRYKYIENNPANWLLRRDEYYM